METNSTRIALFGHRLDSGNLGVDALTRSHLLLLGDEARKLDLELDIDLFAGRALLPAERFSENVLVRQLPLPVMPKRFVSNFLRLPRQFGRYQAAFDLSEGDSFADIYGWRRAYIYSILRILAARAGCSVVVAPMTIGPFKSKIWQWLGARSLSACAEVFARDEQSANVARKLGCLDIRVATDLAMALPFVRLQHESLAASSQVHVGVNPSGLLWSDGYTGKNEFGIRANYRKTMIEIVERLSREPGMEIHLISHVLSAESVEDDRRAAKALKDQFPRCRIAPEFKDSIAAKNYIAGLDLFLGARMHACIAAFSSGIPTLPLAYSMKFEGLFGSLGYRRTIDLRKLDEGEIMELLDVALSQRRQMCDEVERSFARAKDLIATYRSAVGNVLRNE